MEGPTNTKHSYPYVNYDSPSATQQISPGQSGHGHVPPPRHLRASVSAAQLGTPLCERETYRSTRYWQDNIGEETVIHHTESPSIVVTDQEETCSVTSGGRREDAMAIFEEYGISRPQGWLSGAGSHDTDYQEPLPILPLVCHSCRDPLATLDDCNRCGHAACSKCTDDIRREERKTTVVEDVHGDHSAHDLSAKHWPEHDSGPSHIHRTRITEYETRHYHRHSQSDSTRATTRPSSPAALQKSVPNQERPKDKPPVRRPSTTGHVPMKTNPFLIADRETKGRAAQPQTDRSFAKPRTPPRLSDCLPSRRVSHVAETQTRPATCSIPILEEENHEHTAHASPGKGKDGHSSHNDWGHACEDSADPLQKKIDQLYHHAEDLNHSQHIMEHLAAGAKNLGPPKTAPISRVGSPVKMHSLTQEAMETYAISENRSHDLGSDMLSALSPPPLHRLTLERKLTMPRIEPLAQHGLSSDMTYLPPLSPKSHDLSDDVLKKVAGWEKFHSTTPKKRFQRGEATSEVDLGTAPLVVARRLLKPSSPRSKLEKPDRALQSAEAPPAKPERMRHPLLPTEPVVKVKDRVDRLRVSMTQPPKVRKRDSPTDQQRVRQASRDAKQQ